jgi:UMF1 family MFS transporter
MGYIGSIILQLVCFAFVLKPEWFGIKDSSFAPRLSFLLVGLWWMGWAQVAFARLPKGTPAKQATGDNIFVNGFNELKKVWNQVKEMPVLKRYLLSFFFYSMGVQTVMLAATLFASQVIGLPTPKLIISLLIIQIVAIAGAYLMAKLSEKFGNFQV